MSAACALICRLLSMFIFMPVEKALFILKIQQDKKATEDRFFLRSELFDNNL